MRDQVSLVFGGMLLPFIGVLHHYDCKITNVVYSYQQTHGLGLLEYLQFAEDMNMEISKF